LSYSQIGSILTCQFAAGAISNIPGGIFVDTVAGFGGIENSSTAAAIGVVKGAPIRYMILQQN